jgi:formylglycine-generating enzyme required for sulfatase activity
LDRHPYSRTFIPLKIKAPPAITPPAVAAEPPQSVAATRNAAQTRATKQSKTSLRERVQAQSATFEFDALMNEAAVPFGARSAVNPRDGAQMVWIPPGEYVLSGRGRHREETSNEAGCLSGYWIYRTPVTVAQYRRFYAEIGRSLKHRPRFGWDDSHPIVNVNWEFAQAYALWAGGSLPTEHEWERAAAGVDGRRFPWGNEWDSHLCCNSVAGKRLGPAKVNSFPSGVTPDGVADMAGNVWEWTAGWFDTDSNGNVEKKGVLEPATPKYRVLRGGCWGNESIADFLTTARTACEQDVRGETIGFRCVVRSPSI